MPQGRVTGFATTPHQVEQARIWNRTYQDLTRGDPRGILFLANARGIDRVVLQKKIPVYRKPADLIEGVVWRPFAFADHRLLQLRHLGILDYKAVEPEKLNAARDALEQAVGAPEFEDDEIIVFRSQKR